MTHTLRHIMTPILRHNIIKHNNELHLLSHNLRHNFKNNPNYKPLLNNRVYQPQSYTNTNITIAIRNITKNNLNRTYINNLITKLNIDRCI